MRNPEIRLERVEKSDLSAWIDTKKACYQEYVDQYYGGWDDAVQAQLNTSSFESALRMNFFRKVVFGGETVGFMGFNELPDRIAGITVHLYAHARNHGIGSNFLEQITELSRRSGKPAYLKVFKTNPARRLYERFGFGVYGETDSHFLMSYNASAVHREENHENRRTD